MFLLFSFDPDGPAQQSIDCHGVYDCKDKLYKGVDWWMKQNPNRILTYTEWVCNEFMSAEEWDWCYIPVGSDVKELAIGGGKVPRKSWWGKNLALVDWSPEEDIDAV